MIKSHINLKLIYLFFIVKILSMTISNSFSVLFSNDITIEKSTDNIRRKAMKKLRQIRNLKEKKKKYLSPDEMNKISEEGKWLDILYPERKKNKVPKLSDEEIKRRDKQHQKFKQKQKKKKDAMKKREKKRKDKERQEAEEREKFRKWKKKIDDEYRKNENKRRRKEEEKKEKMNNEHIKNKVFKHPNKEQKIILEEYEQLYSIHHNHDKVFRLLSKKYHPDKNRNNIDWAEKMQKELKNISVLYKC
jgi:hypothetical protein